MNTSLADLKTRLYSLQHTHHEFSMFSTRLHGR